MYAIAFDLVVADTEQHRPKDVMRMDAKIGVVFTKLASQRRWRKNRPKGVNGRKAVARPKGVPKRADASAKSARKHR